MVRDGLSMNFRCLATAVHAGLLRKLSGSASDVLLGTGAFGAVPGLLTLVSSTYTPTLTNVANLDASTAYACQYCRIGSAVIVSGRVDVDPTLTATATQLGVSLPVASDFSAGPQCAGTAFCPAIAGMGSAIEADVTNNRANFRFTATDVTNQGLFFIFLYQVI